MAVSDSPGSLQIDVSNRQIFSISFPIMISILIPQFNMFINNVFLGHLGTEHLGNAGITGIYYLIFAVVGNGLNSGVQNTLSRFAGAGRPDQFKHVLAQAIRLATGLALFGILFTWLAAPFVLRHVVSADAYPADMSFLRIRILGLLFLYFFQMGNAFFVASINSKYILIGALIETLVNIFLDYTLIFGHFGFPKLGFNGAAWASVISEFVGFLCVLLVINFTGLKKKYGLLSTFKKVPELHRDLLRFSVPLIFQFVISITSWLFFFLLVETKGNVAKAISNTMRNVLGFTGIFSWALASTSNTMVGNLIGQRRISEVIPAIKKISIWSLGFAVVNCALLNIFPEQLFRFYGQDTAFIAEAAPVIRMLSVGIIFMSIAVVWLNGVTGSGNTKVSLIIEIISIIAYCLYSWYVMEVRYTSLAKGWSNEIVYWLVTFGTAFFYLRYGQWKKRANAVNLQSPA